MRPIRVLLNILRPSHSAAIRSISPFVRYASAIVSASAIACMLGALSQLGAAESDATVQAARAALADGDVAQAVGLLSKHPDRIDYGEVRLELIRVCAAAQDWSRVAQLISPGDGSQAERWPPPMLPELYWWQGRAQSAKAGDDPALWDRVATFYARALEQRVATVSVDDNLWYLADALERAGRPELALRAAKRLWQSWRKSQWRADAGLMVARLGNNDERRVRIWSFLQRSKRSTAAQRWQAADALCAWWHQRHPLLCVRFAEAELRRLKKLPKKQRKDPIDQELHERVEWTFTRWRAIAVAGLDPAQGLDLLAGYEQTDQLVEAARDRARQQLVEASTDPLASLLVAGHDGESAAVRDLAQHDPVALAIALSAGGQPSAYVSADVADTDLGRLVLAEAAARAGDQATVNGLLSRMTQGWVRVVEDRRLQRLLPQAPGRLLLVAAMHGADQDQLAAAWKWLREHSEFAEASGMAWVTEARRLAESATAPDASQSPRTGGSVAIHQAWIRATERLPHDHPWAASAALEATAPWLAVEPTQAAALERAAEILSGPAWSGDAAVQLRARFRLAQVLVERALFAEAQQCIESLRVYADARQQRALDALWAQTSTD